MIPDKPYNTRCNFNEIIQSIREKYASLQLMKRIALTIPVIPLLGVRETTHPVINNTITNSMYVDD